MLFCWSQKACFGMRTISIHLAVGFWRHHASYYKKFDKSSLLPLSRTRIVWRGKGHRSVS